MGFCTKILLKKCLFFVKMPKARRSLRPRRAKNANCTSCRGATHKRERKKERDKKRNNQVFVPCPAVPLPKAQGCVLSAWFTFVYRNNRTPCGRGHGVQVLHGSHGPRFSLCLPSPFVIIVYHILEKNARWNFAQKYMIKIGGFVQNAGGDF